MPFLPKAIWILVGLLALLVACSVPTGTDQINNVDQSAPDPGASGESSPTTAPADPSPTVAERIDPSRYEEYEIVTLLPPDAIRSIDNPTFLTAEEADEEYEPQELIIGVNFDGDARAYSIPLLSSHEIVNDTVGGRKIAVTW